MTDKNTRCKVKIQELLVFYNNKEYSKIINKGKKLIIYFPEEPFFQNILGVAYLHLGKIKNAVQYFHNAIKIKFDYQEAHSNIAYVFENLNKYDNALYHYKQILKFKANNPEILNKIGIILDKTNKSDKAIIFYKKAIAQKHLYTAAYNNLAISLNKLGLFKEAIKYLSQLIKTNPAYEVGYNNIGVSMNYLAKSKEAIDHFNKAIKINPEYYEAYNNKGIALSDIGELNEAITNFALCLKIKPDYYQAHNNLGINFEKIGKSKKAIVNYKKAITIKPDYSDAHSNLIALYNRHNLETKHKKYLENALSKCKKNDPKIIFRHAEFLYLKKNYKTTVSLLKKISINDLPLELKFLFFELLGKTYDKILLFDKAFYSFKKLNELVANSSKAKKFNNDIFCNRIINLKKIWSQNNIIINKSLNSYKFNGKELNINFLIGFPRSGTTLLDTILRSHPKIQVVEEKEMVKKMKQTYDLNGSIKQLNSLTENDIFKLRNIYSTELNTHIDKTLGNIIIDKLPLNITDLGIINKVFPKAKFLFILRHPCDCVLSCFMQNFKPNEAMVNFFDLERSAKLYSAVMDLWLIYKKNLKIDYKIIKYEDLIKDLKNTCLPALEFLKLDWDENLFNYTKTALNRKKIHTPSYNQVTQPLYNQAIDRWKNYKQHMEKIIPILDPWIKYFNY